MYPKTFLKISIKLLTSLFPVMLQTFFIRRALKGHSNDTPRTLQGYLFTQDTMFLEYLRDSGTGRALGHFGTQGTWALGRSGT